MLSRDPLANPRQLIARVYAYVAYRIGEGADAEDVTSETFERALRYRKSYNPSKGEPLAWLIGIARRCLQDARDPQSVSSSHFPELPAAGDLEEETLRRLTLHGAVAALDERDRELIALRYGADLTVRQIAELLEARTNTIEVALTRARARLAAQLGGESANASAESRIGL